MSKLTTAFVTSAIAATFATGAFASDIKMNVYTHFDTAQVQLLKDGQPVSGYPVQVKGYGTQELTTSDQGVITVKNVNNLPRTFTFSVVQPNGETTSQVHFLRRDK